LKNCDKLNQDPAQQSLIPNSVLENEIKDQATSQSYCIFETLMIEQEANEDESQSNDNYIDINEHNSDQ
jgi:hypothetical protein